MTSNPVIVVAALIEQAGRFLLTRRIAGTHLEGTWEFPGGKCHPGESHGQALCRELSEELGVRTAVGEKVFEVAHAYPDRTVELHFYACRVSGTPTPLLGQEMRWVSRRELATLEFPPADAELIRRLTADPNCV